MDALRARVARERANRPLLPLPVCPFMGSPREASIAPAFMPGEQTTGALTILLLVVAFLLVPAYAQTDSPLPASSPTPKTILLLTDGFTYDDLRAGLALRDVRLFAENGSIALLNPAVSGQATEAAAYLTVGAGDHLRATEKFGPQLYEDGVPRGVADVAAEAYTLTKEYDDPTRLSYERRMGYPPPPDNRVVDVSIPVIRNAQETPRLAARVGALGDALRQAGRRVAVYGDWPAALVAMDGQGAIPDGQLGVPLSPKNLAGTLRDGDVIIVSIAGRSAVRAFARAAAPLARHGIANIILADVASPRTEDGRSWTALGWVVAAGPAFPAGGVLISPTTRTPGLVANVDLAPTVVALATGGTSAFPGGAGRPITALPSAAPWRALDKTDDLTVGITKSVLPLMATFAAFGIGSCLLALLSLQFGLSVTGKISYWGLLIAAGMFLSLLALGLHPPDTIRGYVVENVAVAAALAATAYFVGRWLRVSSIGLLFALLTIVVLIDCGFGGYAVQRAINNYLPGIRYYGIGNEYLGAVVGACLTAVALLRPPRAAAYLLFALLTLAVGLPFFGANSGGALTATVAFVLAAIALTRPNRTRIDAWNIFLAFGLGIALTAGLAFLDSQLSPDLRSHAGAAVAAGESQGVGVWGEIALRKIAMNLRIGMDPRTLIGLACLAPVWYFLALGQTGRRARAAIASRPAFARLLPAVGWGAVAALCFKDSGIVTTLILLACPTAALLCAMLEDAGWGIAFRLPRVSEVV